jgi:hypothetical protein
MAGGDPRLADHIASLRKQILELRALSACAPGIAADLDRIASELEAQARELAKSTRRNSRE